MSNLILCDWNLPYNKETPEIKIKQPSEIFDMVDYWIMGKNLNRIFVCFDAWRNIEEQEVGHIIITQMQDEVRRYANECGKDLEIMGTNNGEVDFNIYEFVIWDEALAFCADMQEHL
jgi:hypothetical protein